MTNFATYIDSGNDKASLAQRGKAKQKRADLRLVGPGLVVTRDGGIPLLSHTYPGNKPDVTQFAIMPTELCGRYAAYTAAASIPGQVTVVFDAGQNSTANFADLRAARIGYVTSLPPSDHSDLLALPKRSRRRVDQTRFPGLTALQRGKDIYGQPTRVILTHSPTLHAGQSRGLDQTLAKTEARLSELAERLARGKTRRDKDAVAAEVRTICKDTWVKRILIRELAGTNPAELSLTWSIDQDARDSLEEEIFGKRVLVTNHDDWPIAEVVAAYRSQSEAEFGFRWHGGSGASPIVPPGFPAGIGRRVSAGSTSGGRSRCSKWTPSIPVTRHNWAYRARRTRRTGRGVPPASEGPCRPADVDPVAPWLFRRRNGQTGEPAEVFQRGQCSPAEVPFRDLGPCGVQIGLCTGKRGRRPQHIAVAPLVYPAVDRYPADLSAALQQTESHRQRSWPAAFSALLTKIADGAANHRPDPGGIQRCGGFLQYRHHRLEFADLGPGDTEKGAGGRDVGFRRPRAQGEAEREVRGGQHVRAPAC
jgi:hypothetical protein